MKHLLFTLFILIPSISNASGWSTDLTVEKIFTEDSDIIVIYTSGGSVYTNGCSANNWIFHGQNEDRRNRAYSTAMTALVSGKKIRFWFMDDCSSWSYHKAAAIMLLK
jgi:hypothetical protein